MHPGRRIGRLGRAALVLPVILGVLAMHVLLLCADGGSDHHGGSSVAVASAAHASHAMAEVADHEAAGEVSEVVGATIEVVAAPLTASGSDGGATAMCLAVLVALGLVLRRLPSAVGSVVAADPPPTRARPTAALAPPPPGPPRLLTLCVLRT